MHKFNSDVQSIIEVRHIISVYIESQLSKNIWIHVITLHKLASIVCVYARASRADAIRSS